MRFHFVDFGNLCISSTMPVMYLYTCASVAMIEGYDTVSINFHWNSSLGTRLSTGAAKLAKAVLMCSWIGIQLVSSYNFWIVVSSFQYYWGHLLDFRSPWWILGQIAQMPSLFPWLGKQWEVVLGKIFPNTRLCFSIMCPGYNVTWQHVGHPSHNMTLQLRLEFFFFSCFVELLFGLSRCSRFSS